MAVTRNTAILAAWSCNVRYVRAVEVCLHLTTTLGQWGHTMPQQNGTYMIREAGGRLPGIIRRYLADLRQRSPVGDDYDPPTFFFAESTRLQHTRFPDRSAEPVVAPNTREG